MPESTINLDSLLEHIPAPNIKIEHEGNKFHLKLFAGPNDRVKDVNYDEETHTFHLTLDFYKGAQAGMAGIYAAFIPGNTKSIVVDNVEYHGAETPIQFSDVPDFTQD